MTSRKTETDVVGVIITWAIIITIIGFGSIFYFDSKWKKKKNNEFMTICTKSLPNDLCKAIRKRR